jgi:hypothetical protein
MATKNDFLDRLAVQLDKYPWANDPAKRKKYMDAAAETLFTSRNQCSIDGLAWLTAWRLCGFKGKPTYKALRALPDQGNAA